MTDDGRTRAARLLAQTPFAMPRAEALTHIEDRRRTLLTRPAPRPATADADFTAPEPMPVIDAPDAFAAEFWRARKVPTATDEPPKLPTPKPRERRPVGDLKAGHKRFRVVDGDKQG
jgi:hypothetical protein